MITRAVSGRVLRVALYVRNAGVAISIQRIQNRYQMVGYAGAKYAGIVGTELLLTSL